MLRTRWRRSVAQQRCSWGHGASIGSRCGGGCRASCPVLDCGDRGCADPPYYRAKVDQEQIGTATETYSSQRANAIVLLLEGRRTALD